MADTTTNSGIMTATRFVEEQSRLRKRWFVSMGTVIVWCAFATNGSALTAVDKNFDQLVREADIVLMGTVEELQSEQLREGIVVTRVRLGALEIVKGQHADTTYTIQVLGGRVNGAFFEVPGAPTFEMGETYIAFIKGNNTHMYPLVGVTQGLFRVRMDPSDQARIIVDSHDRPILGIDRDHALLTRSPRASSTRQHNHHHVLTPSQFIQEIRIRLPQ